MKISFEHGNLCIIYFYNNRTRIFVIIIFTTVVVSFEVKFRVEVKFELKFKITSSSLYFIFRSIAKAMVEAKNMAAVTANKKPTDRQHLQKNK